MVETGLVGWTTIAAARHPSVTFVGLMTFHAASYWCAVLVFQHRVDQQQLAPLARTQERGRG